MKYDTISKSLKDEQEEIDATLNAFSRLADMSTKAVEELQKTEEGSHAYTSKLHDAAKYIIAAKDLKASWEKKKAHNQEEIDYLNKIGDEISKMKEGSIALVNQITTVSKMRIFDPRNLKGVLAGVSLSEESMEKINQKVQDLYIFK